MAKAKSGIQQELTVQSRTMTGTRPMRRLRAQGVIPGVVYGKDMKKPMSVSVNQRELLRLLHTKAGEHAVITLRVDEGKALNKPAMVHAVQHDPVDGHVVHVDFHTILLTERLKVKVAVNLKGEPVGVKEEGGILEHFMRDVEVECLPTEIPDQIEFDVSELKIGETIHVRDLPRPKNATIISEPEAAVASVQTPKVEKEEPTEEAAAAEPEVITEKKDEGEGAAEEGGKAEKPARPPGPPGTKAGAGGGGGEAKKDAKS